MNPMSTSVCQSFSGHFTAHWTIPDPNFFHPGSRIWIRFFAIPDPHQRMISILTQKSVSKLWLIARPRIPWSKRHRIPDPDPQHWSMVLLATLSVSGYHIWKRVVLKSIECGRRNLLVAVVTWSYICIQIESWPNKRISLVYSGFGFVLTSENPRP